MSFTYTFLQPFSKEGLSLKNRVVMSAMTRNFSNENHEVTLEMQEYYVRRAKGGAGLILTEGTIIHPLADGYPNVPYIYTHAQIESWKKVVDAVHKEDTKIFCQLWHCGRISHPDYLGGETPVSVSDIKPEGNAPRLQKPFVAPRALHADEIPGLVEMFKVATENALSAGFDGVEIHAGHGYLLDGFLDANLNNRTDEYGGSVENRCRFLLMVVEAVLAVAGSTRTSVRISPSREMNGIYEWPDKEEILEYLLPKLDALGLTILDVSCARSDYFKTSGTVVRSIRKQWKHILMAGASLSPEEADEEIRLGYIDLVTYGRFFIANPDFIQKITQGETLVPYDPGMLKTLF